ncbi:MAG: DNA-binding protein [Candidatus Brocadia sp.]|nr:DNA-binding protein [Candidatus Brocadia sp.]
MSDKLKLVDELGGRLLDMDKAAEFLGIKKSSLYAMVMRKTIPHIKIGRLTRFSTEMLRDYVQEHTVGAQTPYSVESI